MSNAKCGSIGSAGTFKSSKGGVVISRGIQRFSTRRRKGSVAANMERLYSTKYFMSMPNSSRLTSHRQHHPEPRPAADHLIVSLGRLGKRIALDHGTDTTESAEPKGILGIFTSSGCPALDGL